MKNELTEYVFSLYERGLMDECSPDHFLIKALKGEDIQPQRYREGDYKSQFRSADLSFTFLANIANRLQKMEEVFGKKSIEKFVVDQLSAGKNNYDEAQFFRAISEVSVLCFMTTYLTGLQSGIYEPPLGNNGSNPEARLLFDDEIIIDIEVKTPGFPIHNNSIPEGKIGLIKPNFICTQEMTAQIRSYCNQNGFELVQPRVKKLHDYIESAGKKFQNTINSKHFNLLFINWTYSDFGEVGLNEPLTLLGNSFTGLLNFKQAATELGLEQSYLEKIAAIILYKDNFDSILFTDFRYHWADKSYRLFLNKCYNPTPDYDFLINLLEMNPCNDGRMVEFFPTDYLVKKQISDQIVNKACNEIYNILVSSNGFLSEYNFDSNTITKPELSKYNSFIRFNRNS